MQDLYHQQKEQGGHPKKVQLEVEFLTRSKSCCGSTAMSQTELWAYFCIPIRLGPGRSGQRFLSIVAEGGGGSLCVNPGPVVKFRLLQWIWAVCGRGALDPPPPPPLPPPPPILPPYPPPPSSSPPSPRQHTHDISIHIYIYIYIFLFIYVFIDLLIY